MKIGSRRYIYWNLMIWLTRLNRVALVLNSDMIEHIEVTPDTVITLSNGQIGGCAKAPRKLSTGL